MSREGIYAHNVQEALRWIVPYLEDTSDAAHKAIYFEGWGGLAASAVLKAIAQDPPPSWRNRFDKMIQMDCSRWKSRRALQRAIVEELRLPPWIMAIFDRQDEDDDFSGVDEASRKEIRDVAIEFSRALQGHKCLLVFHNGSNHTVDFTEFGIPPRDQWLNIGTTLLWTFRGRLRHNPEIEQNVDNSHLYLYAVSRWGESLNRYLQEDARELADYTQHQQAINPEIATECCLYLLSLNYKGGDTMDYNWATHASTYWVCDGIIQGGESDEAWEAAAALHQQMRIEDYSSNNTLPPFGDQLDTPPNRWVLETTYSNSHETKQTNVPTVPPESSSFFLAGKSGSDHPIAPLPNDMFRHSDKLRVLKLCRCTFSFSSPPFHCCRSLRFLGLDACKDQPQIEKEEKQDRPAMEFFQSLWVLDICYTDWELDLSPEIIEQMATNIREVHIKKGRIWRKPRIIEPTGPIQVLPIMPGEHDDGCIGLEHVGSFNLDARAGEDHNKEAKIREVHITTSSDLAWRRLQNLRKLRVIEPTCPWETGDMDEFTDMVKLELLDLSGNITMQVLPSLSGATSLKTIVLDGCTALDHVGPEELPPSLESFSLDARAGEEAKISRISLAGCARLLDLTLRGPLRNLEELDLSGTAVKMLNLSGTAVKSLQRMLLLGCLQLHAILWPRVGLHKLTVLRIDSLVCRVQKEHDHAYAAIMDMRFVQSLVLKNPQKFCWDNDRFHLNLCVSSTTEDKGQSFKEKKMGPYSTGKIIGPPLQKSLIPNTCFTYNDVTIDRITTGHDDSSAPQFQPLGWHVEIGVGISNTNVASPQGIEAIIFVMNKAESLHVHDNYSITSVIPESMMPTIREKGIDWSRLKRCRVEKCPKLHTVFPMNYDTTCFQELETFCAADLLMAHCIWSKRWTGPYWASPDRSFAKLRSIDLHCCPRLTFVLPLSWDPPYSHLPNLETLHIVYCGDLRQVFPVEAELLKSIATDHRRGILEFPNLKHIHLHELPSLQQICEAKMSVPMLETIRIRGCWSLRCLPAVGRRHQDNRPVVDCEKDWWEKLEWDEDVGHRRSLFDPRHSQYYKKPMPKGSILR